ncbi:Hypothetical predicted protein [Olea europaea subsp. europaea]|uniref:Uncharacterized protein n=1 Tax=Olea europaea subsp. europaea TaxID=158383 RepID=A0A8S0UP19_OLEEU|nr:Hypothetical predicted protein [Olea europaea subsp. europaea]
MLGWADPDLTASILKTLPEITSSLKRRIVSSLQNNTTIVAVLSALIDPSKFSPERVKLGFGFVYLHNKTKMSEVGVERKRTIKLFCPSLSKIIHVIASDEQKLDLGSIARAFGLDPATIKLNGHFISRGVDLIASSVTWKSLLSFFSARGLSTGTNDSDALVVDGKLTKVGSKRVHDPTDSGNTRTANAEECCYDGIKKKQELECNTWLGNKRFRGANSGSVHAINQTNAMGVKRKLGIDDANLIKRSRLNVTISGNS